MFEQFVQRFNGAQGIGDTPQNDGQCVGLAEEWLDTIGAPHIWGNACDMPANADRGAYVVTPNNPTYVPAVGDLGVEPAGWEGSAVGHVFIVAPGTTVDVLNVFEQNDRLGGGNGACRLHTLSYDSNPTFIHPKVLDPAPAPVEAPPAPTPAPVAEPVVAPAPDPVVETPPTAVSPQVSDTPVAVLPSVDGGNSGSSQPQDVQSTTSENPGAEKPLITDAGFTIHTILDDIEQLPTNVVAETIVAAEGIKNMLKITPKLHHALAVVVVVTTVLSQLAGQLSALQSVSIMSLVTAVVAAASKL